MTPEMSSCLPYDGVADIPPGVPVCWNESERTMEFSNVAPGDRVEFRSDAYCVQSPTASGAEKVLCEKDIRSANLTGNPDVVEEPVGAGIMAVVEVNGDGKLTITIPPERNGEGMLKFVPGDPNHDYSRIVEPTPVPVLTQEDPNNRFPDVTLVLGAVALGLVLYFTSKRVFPPGNKAPTLTPPKNPPQRLAPVESPIKRTFPIIPNSPETRRGPKDLFQPDVPQIEYIDPASTLELPPFDRVVDPGGFVVHIKACDPKCPVLLNELKKWGVKKTGVCVYQPDRWRIMVGLPPGYREQGSCKNQKHNNILGKDGDCYVGPPNLKGMSSATYQ
ncbi:hypothetical protein HYU89_00070 [Candidatus Collierbacteria bacterium]|nr:hypothetical protein [Candidatus Collierbacteria bacterium]